MCPLEYVCIPFNTHILLLLLAVVGFLLLLVDNQAGENKPPPAPTEDLRRKWKDKLPKRFK